MYQVEANLNADAPQEVAEGPIQLGAAGVDLPPAVAGGKDRPSMASQAIRRHHRRQELDALAGPSGSLGGRRATGVPTAIE